VPATKTVDPVFFPVTKKVAPKKVKKVRRFAGPLQSHTNTNSSSPTAVSQRVHHVYVLMSSRLLVDNLGLVTWVCTLLHQHLSIALNLPMIHALALAADSRNCARAAATAEVHHRRPPGRLTVDAVTSAS
jgi:hypothetical protein